MTFQHGARTRLRVRGDYLSPAAKHNFPSYLLHPHDLRHTGLTLAAATGATTAELMHRAGHVSADAALRYQHATKERDGVLADSLDKMFKSTSVGDDQDRTETAQ
jgi:integrase